MRGRVAGSRLVTVERPELVVVLVLVLEIPNKSRRRTSTSTRRMLDFRLCGFGHLALTSSPTFFGVLKGQ
jgi:hypothetical protein